MTVPLTKKKRRWARNREVTLRGNILNYNISIQQKYRKQLQKLIDYMQRYVSRETLKLFRSDTGREYFKEQRQAEAMDSKNIGSMARILMNKLMRKFTQLFDDRAKDLAQDMIDATLKYSKSSLHSSLEQLSGGLSLKTGVMPEGMEDVTRALIAENVSLIKSIPEEYLKNVIGSVMRSITTGNGIPELTQALAYHDGVTDRRAKNIALDQTRKAYNSINKQRLQALNVKQFEWIHSGGGQKPRKSHQKISGQIFNFETLEQEQEKLGVPYADRGIPGHAVNCMCSMRPVINFDDEE